MLENIIVAYLEAMNCPITVHAVYLVTVASFIG